MKKGTLFYTQLPGRNYINLRRSDGGVGSSHLLYTDQLGNTPREVTDTTNWIIWSLKKVGILKRR